MSSELIAALIGALVGGSFALLGSVIRHFLTLREDRIRRERDKTEKEADERRKQLALLENVATVRQKTINIGMKAKPDEVSMAYDQLDSVRLYIFLERQRLELAELKASLSPERLEELRASLGVRTERLEEEWALLSAALERSITLGALFSPGRLEELRASLSVRAERLEELRALLSSEELDRLKASRQPLNPEREEKEPTEEKLKVGP